MGTRSLPALTMRGIFLFLLAVVPSIAFGDGPCRPGDTLIGETERYYYCSRATCADLGAQLGSDERELRKLRDSIQASNAALDAWTRANEAAQAKALDGPPRAVRAVLRDHRVS